MVGTGGFEPPTPYTPSRCAARLRYVPLRPEPKKSIAMGNKFVKRMYRSVPLAYVFQEARTAGDFKSNRSLASNKHKLNKLNHPGFVGEVKS